MLKLDGEEITDVDRDLAKNFEKNNEENDRPFTSIGIVNNNSAKEGIFEEDPFPEKPNNEENLIPEEKKDQIDNNISNKNDVIQIGGNKSESKDTEDKIISSVTTTKQIMKSETISNFNSIKEKEKEKEKINPTLLKKVFYLYKNNL